MTDLIHTFRFKPRQSAIPALEESGGENLINFEWIRGTYDSYIYNFLFRHGNKTIRVEVYSDSNLPAGRHALRKLAAENLEECGYI
jgi:hypothetical protein